MPSSDTQRQSVVLDGVELQLAHPDVFDTHWVGQEELADQLRAAWVGQFENNSRFLAALEMTSCCHPERSEGSAV